MYTIPSKTELDLIHDMWDRIVGNKAEHSLYKQSIRLRSERAPTQQELDAEYHHLLNNIISKYLSTDYAEVSVAQHKNLNATPLGSSFNKVVQTLTESGFKVTVIEESDRMRIKIRR